jgi:hypothetical protein
VGASSDEDGICSFSFQVSDFPIDSESATCPACGNLGLLEAEEVQNERSDGYFDPQSGEHESWG